MEDNYIAKELDKDHIDIIKEYTDDCKLHPDRELFPLTTYDMVQLGYPTPQYGGMIARDWGGTDGENRLLPSNGMWCKVSDVREWIEQNFVRK